MFEILTLIALVSLLLVREILHFQQVKDLTLKIKAATVEEYVQAQPVAKPSAAEVPIQEAKPLTDLDPDQALAALQRSIDEPEEIE